MSARILEHAHWQEPGNLAGKAFNSCLHFSIATINPDGTPHVTPIGSPILGEPGKAVYFEISASGLSRNLGEGAPVAVLGVNASRWLWLQSLYSGRFNTMPAFRLTGSAGRRRPSTERERMLSKCKVRKTRYLKGYDTVWDDLGMVRELHINRRVPVRLGPTNAHFDRVREFDNA